MTKPFPPPFTNPTVSNGHLKVFEKEAKGVETLEQLNALAAKHTPFLREKDKTEARLIYTAKKRTL